MKNIKALFFSIAVAVGISVHALAQQKAVTAISSVKQQEQVVNFTLTSSKPFIFANNRYILHIGNSLFYRNTQSAKNGVGTMIFFIPIADFNALPEGAAIYLTYGNVATEGRDTEAMGKAASVPFWPLGTFSQSLLTK